MSRFFNSKKKFSLENVTKLCDEIEKLESTVQQRPGPMVEALRELAEVVVWGDKNCEEVFDVFLERQLMNAFAELILGDFPSAVKVQVTQCVTIMMQNLTRQQSIYFILSNNHINNIIKFDFDKNDEELMSNVVSFFKSLSLRLNNETVQFFLTGSFPLYAKAVDLLDHDDRMIRTSARQIVMNIIQLTDDAVLKFLEANYHLFLNKLTSFMCVQLTLVDTAIKRIEHYMDEAPTTGMVGGEYASTNLLDTLIEDIVDDLYYINDLADCGNASIVDNLLPTLKRSFTHLVMRGVLSPSRTNAAASRLNETMSPLKSKKENGDSTSSGDKDKKADSGADDDDDDSKGTSSGEDDEKYPPIGRVLALIMAGHWVRVNTWKDLHEDLLERLVGDYCGGGENASPTTPSSPGSQLNKSPIFRALRSREMACAGPAMSLLQAVLKSRITPPEVIKQLLSPPAGVEQPKWPLNREGAEELPTPSDSNDENPVRRGNFLDLAQADEYILEPTSSPLVDSILESIKLHITTPTLSKLTTLHLLLSVLFTLHHGVEPAVLETRLLQLTTLARKVLYNRGESYRHHMFMLYGGTGEASTITPQSLLSHVIEGPTERELCDPYEVLYTRMEKDFSHAASLASFPVDRIGREPQAIVPLLPCSYTLDSSVAAYLPGDIADCGKNSTKYTAVQQRYTDNVPINNRVAQSEDEIEFVEMIQWLVMRERFYSKFYNSPDPLLEEMKKHQPQYKPKDVVNAVDLTKRCGNGIRCEFSPEAKDPKLPTPQPGAVLYVFLDGQDLVVVEPSRDVAEKGTIVFALQVFYTEAVISCKYQFRLRFMYDSPFFKLNVSLAFRERSICQQIARNVHKASRSSRETACRLMRSLLGTDEIECSSE